MRNKSKIKQRKQNFLFDATHQVSVGNKSILLDKHDTVCYDIISGGLGLKSYKRLEGQ